MVVIKASCYCTVGLLGPGLELNLFLQWGLQKVSLCCKESLLLLFSPVHVGPDKTEILAKRGFRFVDPYEKKTILNLNGSVWHVNPASVKASTVYGDSMVTHRVRFVLKSSFVLSFERTAVSSETYSGCLSSQNVIN